MDNNFPCKFILSLGPYLPLHLHMDNTGCLNDTNSKSKSITKEIEYRVSLCIIRLIKDEYSPFIW